MPLFDTVLARSKYALTQAMSLLAFWYGRAKEDQLRILAGHLSFVSLLALVPLLAVMLSFFSAFPVFSGLRDKVEQFLFHHVLPESSTQVAQYLSQFIDNAVQGGVIGTLFLVVVALLVIASVEKALNSIWRVADTRSFITSFSVYWMVLTLGPILVGASIAISSYIGSLRLVEDPELTLAISWVWTKLPLLFSLGAFALIFSAVPNCDVKPKHALIGALFSAVLFEVSKKVFTLYVAYFPSYEAIYGALAMIPILFLWVYIAWLILLMGAELVAALPEWENERKI